MWRILSYLPGAHHDDILTKFRKCESINLHVMCFWVHCDVAVVKKINKIYLH